MQKEINRLLKHLSQEKLKKNNKECIELCNMIGGVYSETGCYSEAIVYHEEALEFSTKIGCVLSTAVCQRLLGECKASLGHFVQALKHIKKYVDLAHVSGDRVEIQRAITTLGRVYLMQAQELRDSSPIVNDTIRNISNLAEQNFSKAMKLAENLRERLDKTEFAQMQSGLFLNMGLLKDLCGEYSESIVRLHKAMEICKQSKLKEDLFRIQLVASGIHRQKRNLKFAVKISEEAYITAKSIGKKILICEALIEKGFVKLFQNDYKAAKKMFSQAYLEQSPNEDDHLKAIKMTKLSHVIFLTQGKITSGKLGNDDLVKLYDKLGDLFTSVGLYGKAVDCYKRAFTTAKANFKSKAELSRLLFSIAETYADNGQLEEAITFYKQELTFRNGNDAEQCQTLLKLAHMREYLDSPCKEVADSYEEALKKANGDNKLLYQILKDYVPYLKKKDYNRSRCVELDNTLLNLKANPEIICDIEDEASSSGDLDLDDQVPCIDDIISEDEQDEEILCKGRSSRTSRNAKKFKTNEMGETPLHEVCIKGDIKRAKALIDNGHDLNPRDNFGWTPLHEACNNGHYDIVELLIEKGANVCDRGPKGVSPLHDAAANGHWNIMKLLIKHGANVISLTDKGETVLSCLREYKKSKANSMSNDDACSCREMEVELLNLMDRHGYNLIEENVKNIMTKAQDTGSISNVEDSAFDIQPKRRDDSRLPKSVNDYKDVIKTLKRKKQPDEENPKEKIKKVPASQWFAEGTSKVELIALSDSDVDDDDDGLIISKQKKRRQEYRFSPSPSPSPQLRSPQKQATIESQSPNKELNNIQFSPSRFSEDISTSEANYNKFTSNDDGFHHQAANNLSSSSPISQNSSSHPFAQFSSTASNSFQKTLTEIVKLTPANEIYLKTCEELNVKFEDFVLNEIVTMTKSTCNKLDLSHITLMTNQIEPLIVALSSRGFTEVDLTGSQIFFYSVETSHKFFKFLETLKQVTKLSLKCTGMRRQQFEFLSTQIEFPKLKHLDVSFNNIVYKKEDQLVKILEDLFEKSPMLTRLDIGVGKKENYLTEFGKENELFESIYDSLIGKLDLQNIVDLFIQTKTNELLNIRTNK